MIFKENYVYSEKFKNPDKIFHIVVKNGKHAILIDADINFPLCYALFNWPYISSIPDWVRAGEQCPSYVTYTELGEIQPRWKIILTLGFCGLYKKTKKVHPAD